MAQSSSEISFNPQPSLQPSTAPGVDAEPAPYTRPVARRRNYIWSELMKRVFLVDVLQCERCGGGWMKILAAIHPPDATGKKWLFNHIWSFDVSSSNKRKYERDERRDAGICFGISWMVAKVILAALREALLRIVDSYRRRRNRHDA